MGIVVTKGIRTSFLAYAGALIGYVNVILLFPKIFTPEEFGLTRIFTSLMGVTIQFTMLGMTGSIIKFFPYFKNPSNRHNDFFTLTISLLTLGLLVVLSFFLIFKGFIVDRYSKDSSLFSDYYHLLIILIVCESVFQLLTNLARANGAVAVNSFLREVALRLMTTLWIGLYYIEMINFAQFMICFVLQYLIIAVFQYVQLLNMGFNGVGLGFLATLKDMRHTMLEYSALTLITAIGTMMLLNIDTLMIGSILGLGYSAFFSLGYYLTSLITIPNVSMMSVLLPIISESWKKNDLSKLEQIYKKSSINQMILGGLLFLLLITNASDLVRILPPQYANVEVVIILVAIAKYIDMSFGVNGALLFTSPKYKLETVINVIVILLNVICSYFLIHRLGLIGGGIAVIIVGLVLNGLRFFVLFHRFNMNPFTRSSVYGVLIMLVVLTLVTLVPINGSWISNIIIRSILIILLYVPPVLALRLSEDINSLTQRFLGRKNEL